jgi:hypothetical protein
VSRRLTMSITEIKTAERKAEERKQAAARLEAVLGSLPPIFASCVNMEVTHRLPIAEPFRQGDHVYATNGRIAVRIPLAAAPGAEIAPESDKPKMSAIFNDQGPWQDEPLRLPKVKVQDCPRCKGSRIQPAGTCPECDGGGEDESAALCECPHCTGSHDCEMCGGKGSIPEGPCMDCDGTGVAGVGNEGRFVVPGVHKVSHRYLALLTKHKAKLFAPVKVKSKIGDREVDSPFRFTVGEWAEGVVMGLSME